MNKELKEQACRDILELFCGVDNGVIDCDTEGQIKLDQIINSLIDKTVQQERGRILGVIEKKMMVATKRKNEIENDPFHPVRCQYLGQEDAFKFVISLITNNSDINN